MVLRVALNFRSAARVVLHVLLRYLHVELAEGIDIPYRGVLLHTRDERLIGGRKHAEAYSRHAVGLGDGFDDDKMRMRIEYRLVDERVVLLIREIGK